MWLRGFPLLLGAGARGPPPLPVPSAHGRTRFLPAPPTPGPHGLTRPRASGASHPGRGVRCTRQNAAAAVPPAPEVLMVGGGGPRSCPTSGVPPASGLRTTRPGSCPYLLGCACGWRPGWAPFSPHPCFYPHRGWVSVSGCLGAFGGRRCVPVFVQDRFVTGGAGASVVGCLDSSASLCCGRGLRRASHGSPGSWRLVWARPDPLASAVLTFLAGVRMLTSWAVSQSNSSRLKLGTLLFL